MSVLERNQNRVNVIRAKPGPHGYTVKVKEKPKFTPAGMVSRIYSHGIELIPSFHRVYFQQPKKRHHD